MSVNLNHLTPLQWRTARADDLPDLFGWLSAISAFDDTSPRWGPEELQQRYARSAEAEGGEMMLGFDGESLVAVGWNTVIRGEDAGVRLSGCVHPAFRDQGIGRALLGWQQHRARAWHAAHAPEHDLRMVGFADAQMTGKRNLYERSGLRPTRWFIDMLCHFPFPERVAEYVLTPALGVDFRPFTPEVVEATRAAHNEAFADRFGSRALGSQEWAASLARESARSDLSWVATDEFDRVVGYALNSVVQTPGMPDLGWTDRLGVRPAHRGRNIARILLARSLDSFRHAALEAGGVGLDSVDGGGTWLYRSLGYEATDTIIQYELVESSTMEGTA